MQLFPSRIKGKVGTGGSTQDCCHTVQQPWLRAGPGGPNSDDPGERICFLYGRISLNIPKEKMKDNNSPHIVLDVVN